MTKKVSKICCIFTIVLIVCNIMSASNFIYGDNEFVPRPYNYCLDESGYNDNSNYGILLTANNYQLSISEEGIDFIIAR